MTSGIIKPQKPRLIWEPGCGEWHCHDGWYHALGYTPKEAYEHWRKYIYKLTGIKFREAQ